jgi:MFS family permease
VSPGGSFGLLRQRDFGWFFAARTVNLLGLTMANVALAFAVLDLTGSAADLGLVLAAHTVPLLLFLLVGGVVADRWPRRLVMQGGNLLSAAAQGLLALLVLTDHADLGTMMALSAVNGLASAVTFPAMAGVLPQVVERRDLQQANVLLSMSRGALTVVGPSLAALLVVTVGPGWALAVDALCWALSAAALLGVRLPAAPARPAERSSPLADLREGWDLFRGTTWLWVVVAGFAVLNALHSGAWLTLGPAQARATFGEQGWGLVLSAEAAGLLLTTVVMLRVRLQRPLLWGMVGMTAAGVPLLLLGLAPRLWLLVAVAVLAGVGFEIFNLGWNLAMQEHVEERQLSRAYSYDALGSYVAMPLGQLTIGPLGEAIGYARVLAGAGVLWLAVCAVVLTSRSVRLLPRATPEAVSVP